MAWYTSLLNVLSGSGGSIIDSVADTVDRFVMTEEDKQKLKMELQKLQIDQEKNMFDFQKQMEELAQKRESEMEQSMRAELEAKAGIMMEELKQEDKYTKRARPTVVYAGLVFIFLEIFGLRYLILSKMGFDNFNDILNSSKEIFETFMWAWAGVVGVYAAGRSVEKRGVKNKVTSAITGSGSAEEKKKEKTGIKW